MHCPRRILFWALLPVGMLLVCGCGSDREPIMPVDVTITYRGQPVSNAHVMFTPTRGRPARGTTDEQGHCQMTTFDENDGVYVGGHTVVVSKLVDVPPAKRSPDYRPGGRLSQYVQTRNALPEKYASMLKSPLTVEVTLDGENKFDFELED